MKRWWRMIPSQTPYVLLFLGAACFVFYISYRRWIFCEECTEKYVFGDLMTVHLHIGGVGNNMFELVSFLGIARTLKRTPVISYSSTRLMQGKHRHFNRIMEGVRTGPQHWWTSGETAEFGHQCGVYRDPSYLVPLNNHYRIFEIDIVYAQSFKYFQSIPRKELMEMLSLDESVQKEAEALVEKKALEGIDYVICVHTRRGDFVESTFHAHSEPNFTIPATVAIVDKAVKDGHKPIVVLFGQDKKWLRTMIGDGQRKDYIIAGEYSPSYEAVAEWEFSRRHCSSVLLTASASTFGWWMATFSSGDVYYNKVYSKGAGFGATLKPDDFFFPHWHPVGVDAIGQVTGI